jgi:hypothetical protein
MPAFEALAVVVAAVFLALIALVAVVIRGIHREERRMTVLYARPPGTAAFVARRVLGLYVRKTEPAPMAGGNPEQPMSRYERGV